MTSTPDTTCLLIMKTKIEDGRRRRHHHRHSHWWNNAVAKSSIIIPEKRSSSSSYYSQSWWLLKRQQWRLLFRQPQPPSPKPRLFYFGAQTRKRPTTLEHQHRCCSLFRRSNNVASSFTMMMMMLMATMMIVSVKLAISSSSSHADYETNVTDLVAAVGANVRLDCSVGRRLPDDGQLHYKWCRFEPDNDWTSSGVGNSTTNDDQSLLSGGHRRPTCFDGERHVMANEIRITTVVYSCEVRRRHHHGTDEILFRKVFKLYVDQFSLPSSMMHRAKRAMIPEPTTRRRCRPPRCKPYATVKHAQCSRIELQIRYPKNQYGYNHSLDYWGTIYCNDHIVGYQIWLIGYGIVKKFFPSDPIVLDNLIPGKRYCFNGWAYNSCGAGPVFTLEGVCAQNTPECRSTSDEHCELDFDYSY